MTLWLTAAKVSVHHRLTTYYVGPKGKKNKIMAEACEVVIHLEVARNQCTEREDKTRNISRASLLVTYLLQSGLPATIPPTTYSEPSKEFIHL